MALNAQTKQTIITKYAASDKDTGSPRVQVALLSAQIDELTTHLKAHKKDNHSRKGLLKIISKRRRLMNYLGKTHPDDYRKVAKELKINTYLKEEAVEE